MSSTRLWIVSPSTDARKYLPFATHQQANGYALPHGIFHCQGSTCTSKELSAESYDTKKYRVSPDMASIKKPEVGLEPRKYKILELMVSLYSDAKMLRVQWARKAWSPDHQSSQQGQWRNHLREE